MADFLEGQQQQTQARIQELAPLVAEYERQAALAALAGLNGGGASTGAPAAAAPARKRGPGHPRGRSSKPVAPNPPATQHPHRHRPPLAQGTHCGERLFGCGVRWVGPFFDPASGGLDAEPQANTACLAR